MIQTTSGEWTIALGSDCSASDLTRGIQALNAELKGGPEQAIAAALMELISATSRPPWMDDAVAAAYTVSMPKAMWDYPIDVVRGACANWRRIPQQGRWWPTEADLRAQCERLYEPRRKLRAQAMNVLRDLEAKEAADEEARQRSVFAGDKGRAFREEMRKRMRPARFEAYFDPSQVMFSEREIWVRTMTAERVLSEEGRDLLERLGLRVVYHPQAFAKIRQPSWEDDTPEERAEVIEKFNRLKQAMADGSDLKAMRARGLI